MSNVIFKSYIAALVILITLPIPVAAMSAITCHCFKDRSYDAARPAAADPYFLATTQISFFAIVFNVDKKNIMMKKQQGISSDELWIAYWTASNAGKLPETVLQARQDKKSWKEIISSLRLTTQGLGIRFYNALDAKSSDKLLAEAVVDELFLRSHLLADKELAAIRKAGAPNQELIIATVIAARTKQPAKQIYLDVKNGSRTWGSLLAWANIDPKDIPREISAILK